MQTGKSYQGKLWLSIFFFILGIFFMTSIMFYFAFGPLIGSFFIAVSIYWFAQWKFKKDILFRDSLILLLLPLFGASTLLLIIWQNPLGDTVFSLLGVFSITIIFLFFRKIKSLA